MEEFTFNVRIAVDALSPEEGFEILWAALSDHIDGALVAPQRQAHLLSVDLADE